MSSIKDRLPESASPRAGMGRDLAHIRENGQASAAEIREFLKTIKGKSPQEVLGVVAQSGLAMSIFLATIGCVVLLIAGSVIPYYFFDESDAAKPKAKAAASAPDNTPENSASPAKATAAVPAKTDAPPDSAETLPDKLGIGETKASDPKTNPLDGDFDNLLDGVD